MTNADIGKTVLTPDGQGVYLGSAEVSTFPGETFATVLIDGKRLVYEVDAVSYPEHPVTQFDNPPDHERAVRRVRTWAIRPDVIIFQ